MEEQAQDFVYSYHFGLYDKAGQWREDKIKDTEVLTKLQDTQAQFHTRLEKLLHAQEPAFTLTERP